MYNNCIDTKQKIRGILVPLNALKSKNLDAEDQGTFAVGTFFLDWLAKSKQTAWQLLPLHETTLVPGLPTKHISSPYKSYGIGLSPTYLPKSYASLFPSDKEFREFFQKNTSWLADYALFCALRDHFGTDDWRLWGIELQKRKKSSLVFWAEKLRNEIYIHALTQWRLHQVFTGMKRYAKKKGVKLVGDLPFYLSLKSPLVWANQKLFLLEKDASLRYVSGVLKTKTAYFGRQVWGHPLYNWKKDTAGIRALWHMRLAFESEFFDMVRLDHAKGFFDYGKLDLQDEKNDAYEIGPGKKVFEEIITYGRQQGLDLYAEDSGSFFAELRACLLEMNISGIKIYRFAYDDKREKLNPEYADIQTYPYSSVAYTTTHDTETLMSYITILTAGQKKLLASHAGIAYDVDDKKFVKMIRDAVIASPARVVIIPIQDYLLTRDRINTPGTEQDVDDPNWKFHVATPIEDLPLLDKP